MKKKTAGTKGPVQPGIGFYGPQYRSPQAMPWMAHDELSTLKSSNNRALTIRGVMVEGAEQSRWLKNLAEFQGGSTADLSKRNKITNP